MLGAEARALRPSARRPRCRTIRRRRFYQRGPPRPPRRRRRPAGSRGCWPRTSRAPVRAHCQRRQQVAARSAARGVGRSVKYQRSTSGAMLREHRREVLVRHRAEHRVRRRDRSPSRRGWRASAATECGLCATSSTSAGWPGTIWKRPGSSTIARPLRTACAVTGSRSRSASSAASTPEALSNWLAPRSAG